MLTATFSLPLLVGNDELLVQVEATGERYPYCPATATSPAEGGRVEDVGVTLNINGHEFDITHTLTARQRGMVEAALVGPTETADDRGDREYHEMREEQR